MTHPIKQDFHPHLGNKLTKSIGTLCLKVLGWKLEGQFPNEKKMVFCLAPHTSNWDFFIAIFAVLQLQLRASWMGKKQIFVWPVKSLLLKLGGIPVDRAAPGGLVQQIVDEFERSESMIFALAPEGTRKKVENWKSGFLRIAKQANVPVYMIYFNFEDKVFGFHPERIDVTNINESMDKIRQFYKSVPAKYPENTN